MVDPGAPAGSLIASLAEAGVDVDEVRLREHAQACGALLDAVTSEQVRHLGQSSLTNAVTGAERRQLGDVWLWNRASSGVDITPLVAVTLAFGAIPAPAEAEFFAY
jgi:hypothetical protein